MTVDLSTPEIKAAIAQAVADAVSEETASLKFKNQQLVDKLKRAKNGEDEVDAKRLEDLEDKVQDLTSQLKKANADLKTEHKRADEAEKSLDLVTKDLRDEKIGKGLLESLASNGVTHAVHQKAALALLKNSVELTTDGDKQVAKVGDKLLPEYVKEWAAGEEGKFFVTAPANSGGGSGGSGTKPTVDLSNLSPTARLTAARAASK